MTINLKPIIVPQRGLEQQVEEQRRIGSLGHYIIEQGRTIRGLGHTIRGLGRTTWERMRQGLGRIERVRERIRPEQGIPKCKRELRRRVNHTIAYMDANLNYLRISILMSKWGSHFK